MLFSVTPDILQDFQVDFQLDVCTDIETYSISKHIKALQTFLWLSLKQHRKYFLLAVAV